MNKIFLGILFIMFGLLVSCEEPEQIVLPKYEPKNLHEAYKLSLEGADLSHTALGREWINAEENALHSPISINAPYDQVFYVLESEAKAFGYKLEGLRGQKVIVSLEQTAGDSTQIFLDAFRVPTDSLGIVELIASADETDQSLAFEIVEDGSFIIRFQNELLRKGQFRIKIIKAPALEFPVAGGTKSDIGSLFGVPRDAGKRRHEGIDIFARRHAPIIAPTDGEIRWAGVREGSLGGNVIWMRDTVRQQTLYFAHLQDVFVKRGAYAAKGDTIGSVGNSGNAITTAPHLHFGIYRDGAIDPYNHVVPLRTHSSKLLSSTKYLGQLVSTKRNTQLRFKSGKEDLAIQLDKDQLLRVNGCYAAYYNVALPSGQTGYVFYDDIKSLERPLYRKTCTETSLLDQPSEDAIVLTTIQEEDVKVLATSMQNYLYVEVDNGLQGWIHI